MRGAQPIDTAPQDGTKILIFHPVLRWTLGKWDDQRHHSRPRPFWSRMGNRERGDRENPPTHWQPLPPDPPPASEAVLGPLQTVSTAQIRRLCGIIEEFLPEGHGFIVLAAPVGEAADARLRYASNLRREDAIATMKEWLIQAGGAEEWMKNIK